MRIPVLDRIIVRRLTEANESLIEIPEQYRQQSRKGIVVATSPYFVQSGVKINTFEVVQVGDTIFFGEYNAEPVIIDGEELLVIRIQDIRFVERQ